ncbi:hypothetical protein [Photobacterium sp. Hal280]|uniref:hypothetical protein n=1 Tax=Photobacterium sp. Hal280 TaxID=3035163 RepID=UPI00301D23A8
MKEFTSLFSDVLKDRLKNTLLVNFVFSWVFVNHSLVFYLIFSEDSRNTKLEKLDSLSFSFMTDLILPLLVVSIYVFILPLVNLFVSKAKFNFVDEKIVKQVEEENQFKLDQKVKTEGARVKLALLEKSSEVELDQKRAIHQAKLSKSIEDEAKAVERKNEAEKEEISLLEQRKAEFEKVVKLEDVVERINEVEKREDHLRQLKKNLDLQRHDLDTRMSGYVWGAFDVEVEESDRVTFSYESRRKGKNIAIFGNRMKESVELGLGQMPEDFEMQLIGRNLHDEFIVKFHFPNDFHKEDLAGRHEELALKIENIEKKVIPIKSTLLKKRMISTNSKYSLDNNLMKLIKDELNVYFKSKPYGITGHRDDLENEAYEIVSDISDVYKEFRNDSEFKAYFKAAYQELINSESNEEVDA